MATGRIHRLATAIGLVVAVAATAGWSGGTVEAGNPTGTATITVYVTGADADAVAAAATPTTTGSLVCTSGFTGTDFGLFATQQFSCTSGGVAIETIGITGVPANALVSVSCTPNAGQPDQIQPSNEQSTCSIYVDIPTLIVDKVVIGGSLTSSDFAIEVYDDGGTLVTTANDPDPQTCVGVAVDLADCSVVALEAGSYQLGEAAAYGYAVDNVGCTDYPLISRAERFGAGVGEFSIGGVQEPIVEYCEVTNRYYDGNLIVEKVVVNDDGGVATAADFAAEVYEEDGGALALSEQCIADGSCIDADLGIGTYRIGETGPAGYTATVACVETQEPDGPPPTGTTPPTIAVPNEALPGDAALAEILPFNQVTCTITNDDAPQPTTTSTTTTTTTTTTLAPTTTALGAAAGTLPATGTSANANSWMAMIAMALLASGGVLLLVRRRTV